MWPTHTRDEELTGPEAQAAVQQRIAGYWTTQILYTAAKLAIADHVADGPKDVEVLARATGMYSPSLYRLMRTLAGLGLFRERPVQTHISHAFNKLGVSSRTQIAAEFTRRSGSEADR